MTSTEKQNQEADRFACALLMPEKLFREEWNRLSKLKSLDEDARLKAMSKAFQVPLFAVVMRIQMLAK